MMQNGTRTRYAGRPCEFSPLNRMMLVRTGRFEWNLQPEAVMTGGG